MTANKSLKVTFVAGSISRLSGGVFGAMTGCALALCRQGVETSVLGLHDDFAAEDRLAWAPLEPRTVPPLGPAQFGYAPDFRRVLDATNPDIVHQHGIWQVFSHDVAGWRRSTGRSVVISPHGMLDPWALRNAGWKKMIARRLFEKDNLDGAACLHALNESEVTAIRAFGVRVPVAVISNGVVLPDTTAHVGLDARTDRRRTLMFIGRIHPKKGLVELLRAFALLRAIAPAVSNGWRLVIAGWDDGGHLSDLEVVVRNERLGEVVSFTGPLYGAAKDEALRDADAFVLPSFSEGLPMAVLEAAAYRLPILITEDCNLPEFFDEGAAYQISTDPQTLAHQLATVLDADDHAARAAAARTLVERHFGWARISEDFLAVYRWLEQGGDPPSCVVQS